MDNDKSILDHVSTEFKISKMFLTNSISRTSNRLGSYNFIFLMQVLEHLPTNSFHSILRVLFNHLNEGGYLVCVVPNGNNPLGLVERYVDLQHTTCFTEQSLQDLVNLSEIENYQIEIKGFEIPPYNPINLIRLFLQKILHFILFLIMIINGGAFFKTMTPNIMLIIRKNES